MKLKKVIAGIMAAVVSASVLLSNDIPSLVINASAASTDGYSDKYGIVAYVRGQQIRILPQADRSAVYRW